MRTLLHLLACQGLVCQAWRAGGSSFDALASFSEMRSAVGGLKPKSEVGNSRAKFDPKSTLATLFLTINAATFNPSGRPYALPGCRPFVQLPSGRALRASSTQCAIGSIEATDEKEKKLYSGSNTRFRLKGKKYSGKYLRKKGDTAPVDVEKVERLFLERAEAYDDKDRARWDEIKEEFEDMGVVVNEEKRRWCVKPGHYSRLKGDDAPVDFMEVKRLVSLRHHFRGEKKYKKADSIRNQLGEMGVAVDDDYRVWFVRKQGPGFYHRRLDDKEEIDETKVDNLFNERVEAAIEDDLDRRNEIGKQLNEMGVHFMDSQRIWWVGGFFRRRKDDTAPIDVPKVEAVLDELYNSHRISNFSRVDELRDELGMMGVSMDSNRQWFVNPNGPGYYTRSEDDKVAMDAEYIKKVNSLLDKRHEAKRAGKYQAADALQEELKLMGVVWLDKAREWSVGGTYKRKAGNHDSPHNPVDVKRVQELLARRNAMRRNQDFESSDELQKELLEMGVVILDKTKEWFVPYSFGLDEY